MARTVISIVSYAIVSNFETIKFCKLFNFALLPVVGSLDILRRVQQAQ